MPILGQEPSGLATRSARDTRRLDERHFGSISLSVFGCVVGGGCTDNACTDDDDVLR